MGYCNKKRAVEFVAVEMITQKTNKYSQNCVYVYHFTYLKFVEQKTRQFFNN